MALSLEQFVNVLKQLGESGEIDDMIKRFRQEGPFERDTKSVAKSGAKQKTVPIGDVTKSKNINPKAAELSSGFGKLIGAISEAHTIQQAENEQPELMGLINALTGRMSPNSKTPSDIGMEAGGELSQDDFGKAILGLAGLMTGNAPTKAGESVGEKGGKALQDNSVEAMSKIAEAYQPVTKSGDPSFEGIISAMFPKTKDLSRIDPRFLTSNLKEVLTGETPIFDKDSTLGQFNDALGSLLYTGIKTHMDTGANILDKGGKFLTKKSGETEGLGQEFVDRQKEIGSEAKESLGDIYNQARQFVATANEGKVKAAESLLVSKNPQQVQQGAEMMAELDQATQQEVQSRMQQFQPTIEQQPATTQPQPTTDLGQASQPLSQQVQSGDNDSFRKLMFSLGVGLAGAGGADTSGLFSLAKERLKDKEVDYGQLALGALSQGKALAGFTMEETKILAGLRSKMDNGDTELSLQDVEFLTEIEQKYKPVFQKILESLNISKKTLSQAQKKYIKQKGMTEESMGLKSTNGSVDGMKFTVEQ